MTNPFLTEYIDFAHLEPLQVTEAVDQNIVRIQQALEQAIADTSLSLDTLAQLFYEVEALSYVWRVANQLHSVVNSAGWRAVIQDNLPKITQLITTIHQHPLLYQRLKWLLAHASLWSLDEQTLLAHQVRDFRLSGAELSATDRATFLNTQTQLANLALKFEQNVLDATKDGMWYVTDPAQLAGIPDDIQASFYEAAQKAGQTGYQITLQSVCYQAVLHYAHHRALREKMYRAYVVRASELGNPKYDNTALINEHLDHHQAIAHLLGFTSYAEVSLVPKMACSPQAVIQFLQDLANKARPFAQKELAKLTEFARSNLDLSVIEPWDRYYVAEQYRQKHHALSSQVIRQYFPIHKVLSGLFALIHQLYNVTVQSLDVPLWHPDVQFYQLFDQAGHMLGGFYLDLYARDNKQEGAWMNGIRNRFVHRGQQQKPMACVTCNFTPPTGDQPVLLTHDEVQTLFHELGHGLHHLLTQVDTMGLSGMEGVEWDAVELPSQFMEGFSWEWDVLQQISEHVATKEPLPRALYESLLQDKHFQSALKLLRQIEFGLFDMMLHDAPDLSAGWMALLDQVRAEVSVIQKPAYDRSVHSFLHVFAGGYTAGYYSYLWAEVLSSDVYAAFKEASDRTMVGKRFRETILAVGSTRSMAASFRAFRGRDPDMTFLLQDKGLDVASSQYDA